MHHIWRSEVRSYELDSQSIVNNANYFHYMDNARVKFLFDLGIDWDKWHNDGFDLVLVQSQINFKKPLKAHDEFSVQSEVSLQGRLKVIFKQRIVNERTDSLYADAVNTVVCLDINRNKPCMPDALLNALKGGR
ncbi:MAG: thioesterase family protein [Coxiellaceae bacterium]|nr:thioesterase family protein [Coxiellaceae bacterium]